MGATLARVLAACALGLSEMGTCKVEAGATSSVDVADWEPRSRWLSEGSVLLIRNFISKREALSLKATAEKLFAVDNGARWREAVYNTAFLQGPHVRELLTDDVMALERRVENVTGIPMHRDEALLMFTRHRPGALPAGQLVRNVHHDKNLAERRTVTVLIYLTSARSDADGGHTIFPTLPAESPSQAEDGDPIPYLTEAFKGAFRDGKRSLSDSEKKELWDRKALEMVKQECALALKGRSRVLAVRPRRGTALVFWHVGPDGAPNPLAWHAGCHAEKGGGRFTAQKFKEPLMGEAFEDQNSERGPGASPEL